MTAKQQATIMLGRGVNQRIDPKLVEGNLLTLENADFRKTGALSKRNGFSALSTDIVGGGSIADGYTLAAYRDELLLHDGYALYSYSEDQSAWVRKGICPSLSIATERLLPASFPDINGSNQLDCGIRNGIMVVAGCRSGATFATVTDLATGTLLLNVPVLHGSEDAPRVVVIGNYICVIQTNDGGATQLVMHALDTTNPTAGFTTSLLRTDVAGSRLFDAVALDRDNEIGVIAYDTNTTISVITFNHSGVIAGPTTITANCASDTQIGVTVTAAHDIYVAYRLVTTNTIQCFALNQSLSSVFSPVNIVDDSTANHFVGYEEATNQVRWYWDATAIGTAFGSTTDKPRRRINTAVINSSGSLLAGATTLTQFQAIASRPFIYDGYDYMITHFGAYTIGSSADSYQSSYFLTDLTDGKPVARILPNEGVQESWLASSEGGHGLMRPTNVRHLDSNRFVAVLGATYANGTSEFPTPTRVTLDFGHKPQVVRYGENAYLTGGQLWEYDGETVYENNFHLFPELDAYQVYGTGGALSDGVYQVTAAYVCFDAKGNIHRSGIAPPISVILNAGTATQEFTVVAMPYQMGRRANAPYIEYFVTEANGDVFYSDGTSQWGTTDDEEYKTIDGVDVDNPFLYTTGGIVENGAVPAPRALVRSGKRLFAYTAKGKVYFTQEYVEGDPASFSPFLTHLVDYQDESEYVRLADLNGRIAVLSEEGIQLFFGEGPASTGTNGRFEPAQQIATDVGLAPGSPVITTDEGVFFKSPKGIYLLDASLKPQYVGGAVEDLNDFTTTSASLQQSTQEIRFTTEDGYCLVYDYQGKEWTTFTGLPAASSTIWRGNYAMLRPDGVVWVEDPTSYTDAGSAIATTVETGWFKPTGLQGHFRLGRVYILGELRSPCTLNLEVYYNYSDTVADTRTFTLTGSEGELLQKRVVFGKKCEAVKFKLYDAAHTGTGEGVKLNALTIEYGPKRGLFKGKAFNG